MSSIFLAYLKDLEEIENSPFSNNLACFLLRERVKEIAALLIGAGA